MRLIALVIGVALLSVVASAGYSPHWQNPVEIEEQSQVTRSVVVYSSFEESDDQVTIEVTDELSEYVDVQTTEFTLTQDEPARTVKMQVDSGGLSQGSSVDGTIEITHTANNGTSGSDVVYQDQAFMEITVVENTGIISLPGAGDIGFGGVLFGLTTGVFLAGGIAWYRWKNREVDREVY